MPSVPKQTYHLSLAREEGIDISSQKAKIRESMDLPPIKILREAVRAVPAVKYALGVAGITAVVALVKSFGISPQHAVFGTVITLVLMVALIIFAKLTTTAPRHFVLPVLVLMWSFLALTIATALLLFSSAFFKWPTALRNLVILGSNTVSSKEIHDRLNAALLQGKSGDYEGAWKIVKQAQDLAPDSPEVREQQIQVAMLWLRNISVTGKISFAQVVDQLLPCLYQGLTQAKGAGAADIYAHIGWGNFLKSREGARGLDIEGEYQLAVEHDPQNPFAQAMWGHWTLVRGGSLAEAKQHFALALKSGRERAFVRTFQIAALQWRNDPEHAIETIRVADEMRKGHETLSSETESRLLSSIYFMNQREVIAQLPTILPAEDHLATFLWLTKGQKTEQPAFERFFLARLTEAAGDCPKAISLYLSLLSLVRPLGEEVEKGIVRCRQKAREPKAVVQTLIESSKDKDASVRERAVMGLARIGADPADVLPTLISAARDENSAVRLAAFEGLGELGAPAVPGLVQVLDSKEPEDVQSAAMVLGRIGPDASPAVPTLIKLLRHQEKKVRSAAVDSLGGIGSGAAAAVQPLLELLRRDRALDMQKSIAYAFGEFGPNAKPAVPALAELVKTDVDKEGFLNVVAADALGKIGPAAAAAVPILVEALKSDDVRLPSRATAALGEIGAEAKTAMPALIEAMRADDNTHPMNQAEALGKIAQSLRIKRDAQSIPALNAVLRALENQNFEPKVIAPVREALDSLKEKRSAR